ncbi:hypothetical protein NDU88_000586 [Pleurodeles waltl]|uniref:Uncharacterized protein n=1 Tax=Pleurodeles waltl TaxID=8319 RepID=A0AAV7P1G5_PLEWA|nr:hypothetical protein NDU88_000586 [Pleurodeles waltl]
MRSSSAHSTCRLEARISGPRVAAARSQCRETHTRASGVNVPGDGDGRTYHCHGHPQISRVRMNIGERPPGEVRPK